MRQIDSINLLFNPCIQMEWHSGNTLSQTIFTCLFVHHLDDIDPEFVPQDLQSKEDPLRPLGLITIVLRSAVFGLLKSCDLSWRELSKGGMREVSDTSLGCEHLLIMSLPY
jgi:hypothetical protein